jgi:hypothetical protein
MFGIFQADMGETTAFDNALAELLEHAKRDESQENHHRRFRALHPVSVKAI